MDPKGYIPESHEDAAVPTGGPYTFTVTADELQVIQLALGELFSSARRGEHLIPIIESLQARLARLAPTS
jgi:hypothetical protein